MHLIFSLNVTFTRFWKRLLIVNTVYGRNNLFRLQLNASRHCNTLCIIDLSWCLWKGVIVIQEIKLFVRVLLWCEKWKILLGETIQWLLVHLFILFFLTTALIIINFIDDWSDSFVNLFHQIAIFNTNLLLRSKRKFKAAQLKGAVFIFHLFVVYLRNLKVWLLNKSPNSLWLMLEIGFCEIFLIF